MRGLRLRTATADHRHHSRHPPRGEYGDIPCPRGEWIQRSAANKEKAHANAEPIRLIFDGDSITDGWQGRGK
ncbi:MAG: hypothetical protein PHQ12_13350, partial [Chthoniobacteraceae bacterium]|nr:hypothetical protein [Chthoniobacteraceae bacterium]